MSLCERLEPSRSLRPCPLPSPTALPRNILSLSVDGTHYGLAVWPRLCTSLPLPIVPAPSCSITLSASPAPP
eukprot:scaffold2866_cov148-Isochrysis_galbana.AAC.7